MNKLKLRKYAGRMSISVKIIIAIVFCFFLLCFAAASGTSNIKATDTISIIFYKIFNLPANNVSEATAVIVWKLRLPRVILSFIVGACLSIAGTVFQSVLKNHLASPYILGLSSGASLGAGIIMVTGFALPLIGAFTMPIAGFIAGLLTVFLVITFSGKIDKSLSNNTVILCGMVFSLFVNAILTTLIALYREELKTLIIWQMGSFAMRGALYVQLILPFFIIGTLGVMRLTREMDILTFGEENAKSVGVAVESAKKQLFFFGAVLTGGAVALSGTIGFVDLVAPHVARRIVGAVHKYVVPMAALTGGALMVISDLIARTIVAPSELPVGAVTALIGAPFFAYIYFKK
ncbi:MAG: iron ABC transporter permease [Termitinemataceae bacterium]|nr:MAG: iron ABC transporter permease [Termitinemataceae bacterium]